MVVAGDRKELSGHTHLEIHALAFMAIKDELNPLMKMWHGLNESSAIRQTYKYGVLQIK